MKTPLSPFRELTIIAQDPEVRGAGGKLLLAKVKVPREDLAPGPKGARVHVVWGAAAALGFVLALGGGVPACGGDDSGDQTDECEGACGCLGCAGRATEMCDVFFDCQGYDAAQYDRCVVNYEGLEGLARDSGCVAEYSEYSRCVLEDLGCNDGVPSLSECFSEWKAFNDCL